MKNQYGGGDCLKGGGGAWTIYRFKGWLCKKEGDGVFEGGWYPDTHYVIFVSLLSFQVK